MYSTFYNTYTTMKVYTYVGTSCVCSRFIYDHITFPYTPYNDASSGVLAYEKLIYDSNAVLKGEYIAYYATYVLCFIFFVVVRFVSK